MSSPLVSQFRRLRRKLRWFTGRGWSAEDFEARYSSGGGDVWGYRGSPQHQRRAEAILRALPRERFEHALEVGCAQGFLSERLAPRVDRLVACDFSSQAIERARENCRNFGHLEFRVADIRDGFPGEDYDLCLFSDVLYYLKPREIDAVLAEAARKTRAGGVVLIANEWRGNVEGLTPPTHAIAQLDASPLWTRMSGDKIALGDAALFLAAYRRRS